MYEQGRFLAELDTFICFKTCVDQNPDQFERARAWIKHYFDPAKTVIDEYTFNSFSSLLIQPSDSSRPKLLDDGIIGS